MSDNAFDSITRLVTRKGKRVELVTMIGDYTSKPEVYEFPSYQKAKVFEIHACKITNGLPSAIDRGWLEFKLANEEPDEEKP